jgi:cation transport regulator ChaC
MIYYFAYGSCMDERSFAGTVGYGNYQILGRAILSDYRLAFNLYSDYRKGGVADIVPDKGKVVEGILYHLRPEALVPLDEREGVAIGLYRRMNVMVSWEHKRVEAFTYTVVNKELKDLAPSKEYAQLIYNGVKRFLSDHYKEELVQTWKAKFGLTGSGE